MVFCSSPDHSHEHGLRWPLETTWTMDTNIVPPLVDHGAGSGAGWRSRAFVSSRLLHTTLLLCSPRCFYTCCCGTAGSLGLTIMLAAWRKQHHCVLLTAGRAARATEAATTCQRPSHWPKGTNHRPYSATTFPFVHLGRVHTHHHHHHIATFASLHCMRRLHSATFPSNSMRSLSKSSSVPPQIQSATAILNQCHSG